MINIKLSDSVPFNNNVDYCVGTGRMGLALQKEYMEQLELVQNEIGFSHIRGHGLFHDDMAIYQEYEEDGVTKAEYNFTYLDLVMDSYLKLKIKPFIELGFMPKKLASSEQTVFYWEGNVTPPKSYEGWCQLVCATLSHLMERYGADEVVTWPIEVWNEPNLSGFWKDADMPEYFKLFKTTFEAIKALDSRFTVGGPAICGVDDERWIREFMAFCDTENLAIDFVTRHHYTTLTHEGNGHYMYARLEDADDKFANLHTTREIVDSFKRYNGLPIHITEFNTSYTPDNVIHDTNLNAAYIARQLSRLGDDNASYSYWTFGDIFEERGVPFAPFHGGFGMVANRCIPKPTFYAFKFFKNLTGKCIYRDDSSIVVNDNGVTKGIAWNPREDGGDAIKLSYSISDVSGEFSMITETVDEKTCNPMKIWHDLGEPRSLTNHHIDILKNAAKPLYASCRLVSDNNSISFDIDVAQNGVIYFELTPSTITSDRGYRCPVL